MTKSINASGAVLNGLLWQYKGRLYPGLSPLASPEEVDAYFNANNGYDSSVNPTHCLESEI